MRRSGILFSAPLLFLIVASITANCQQVVPTDDERRSVLTALTRFFGPPIDTSALIFGSPEYRIIPAFSNEGVLVSIRIDASGPPDSNLSRSDFDRLLTLLDSVKSLGKFEEKGVVISHGGRDHVSSRYDNGYLYTTEPIGSPPHRVQSASLFYIHSVSGVARFPTASKPDPGFVCSFCTVCVDDKAYIAPDIEFQKLRLKPNEVQQLNVAGPINGQDACAQNQQKE